MSSFAEQYPYLDWWVESQGYIELGQEGYNSCLLRILDEGGTCWEDEGSATIAEALAAGEAFLTIELPERFGLARDPETGEFEQV